VRIDIPGAIESTFKLDFEQIMKIPGRLSKEKSATRTAVLVSPVVRDRRVNGALNAPDSQLTVVYSSCTVNKLMLPCEIGFPHGYRVTCLAIQAGRFYAGNRLAALQELSLY
jgi:hypothetical protein